MWEKNKLLIKVLTIAVTKKKFINKIAIILFFIKKKSSEKIPVMKMWFVQKRKERKKSY